MTRIRFYTLISARPHPIVPDPPLTVRIRIVCPFYKRNVSLIFIFIYSMRRAVIADKITHYSAGSWPAMLSWKPFAPSRGDTQPTWAKGRMRCLAIRVLYSIYLGALKLRSWTGGHSRRYGRSLARRRVVWTRSDRSRWRRWRFQRLRWRYQWRCRCGGLHVKVADLKLKMQLVLSHLRAKLR